MDDLTKKLLIELAKTVLKVLGDEKKSLEEETSKTEEDEYYRSKHPAGTMVYGADTFERYKVLEDKSLLRAGGSRVKKGEKL